MLVNVLYLFVNKSVFVTSVVSIVRLRCSLVQIAVQSPIVARVPLLVLVPLVVAIVVVAVLVLSIVVVAVAAQLLTLTHRNPKINE